MYIFSKLADKDIEELLEKSIINFGAEQTLKYFNSLKNCLTLLSDNPAMGIVAVDIIHGYR